MALILCDELPSLMALILCDPLPLTLHNDIPQDDGHCRTKHDWYGGFANHNRRPLTPHRLVPGCVVQRNDYNLILSCLEAPGVYNSYDTSSLADRLTCSRARRLTRIWISNSVYHRLDCFRGINGFGPLIASTSRYHQRTGMPLAS